MKRYLFSLAMLVGTVLFLEFALAVLALMSPKVGSVLGETPPMIADERLGARPNPARLGHDRNGFRNPEVPERVDIVALGDSQTYGTGVLSDEAWPRRLASLIDRTTYSIAYGGFGPVHSLILMEEALEFRPEMIIKAFYAGNDLYDSFHLVYNAGRQTDLKNTDPDTVAALRRSEEDDSVGARASRLFAGGEKDTFAPLDFVLEHSMMLGLLDTTVDAIGDWLRGAPALRSAMNAFEWRRHSKSSNTETGASEPFDNGRIKTVFALEYRRIGMNLEDPRISEGLRICLESIRRMKKIASDRGVEFRVLLIPTKALVFKKVVETPSPAYRSFVANEEELWRRSARFFKAHGIEVIDALPSLQAELAEGTQPYPRSDGGHPNRSGQDAIARLVATELTP